MSGVPVSRQISPWVALPEYIYSANDPKITDEPGTWFPLAEAEALVAVAETARVHRDFCAEAKRMQNLTPDHMSLLVRSRDALDAALDRLDALTKGDA